MTSPITRGLTSEARLPTSVQARVRASHRRGVKGRRCIGKRGSPRYISQHGLTPGIGISYQVYLLGLGGSPRRTEHRYALLARYLDGLAGVCSGQKHSGHGKVSKHHCRTTWGLGLECMRAASGRSRLMRWPAKEAPGRVSCIRLQRRLLCIWLRTSACCLCVWCGRPTVWFRKTEQTG